ncbi:hypothetical protein INR49_013226, partial [Caranx melampygus]
INSSEMTRSGPLVTGNMQHGVGTVTSRKTCRHNTNSSKRLSMADELKPTSGPYLYTQSIQSGLSVLSGHYTINSSEMMRSGPLVTGNMVYGVGTVTSRKTCRHNMNSSKRLSMADELMPTSGPYLYTQSIQSGLRCPYLCPAGKQWKRTRPSFILTFSQETGAGCTEQTSPHALQPLVITS